MFLGCKVHLTFKDPNMNFSNTSGSKAIVVKHMPLGVTSLEFYDTVRGFGRIISCKVMIDRSGTECYALLQFENQETADRCMQEMNGAIYNGNTIALTWQFPKNSPYQYPTKGPSPPPATRPGEGRTTPSPGWQNSSSQSWNQPTQNGGWSQVPTPPSTPQWQTAPPVNFVATSWQSPSANSPPDWSQGSPAPASWAAPPQPQTPGWTPPVQTATWESPPHDANLDNKNLYIKNLEDHIDNLELFNMFRKFGRIVSARVMRDDATGRSKGFGFVSFEADDQAQRAIAELNGRKIGLKTLVINVAEPKAFRERKLSAYHATKTTGV
ncbi:Protein phosphatase PP2A regulatory subunit B [Nowakowskiella sp. JEL0078]|nr:Protein phosphatase PP2A regulatory subunit B [Nowakowskiella sp. JEL0078]